MKPLYGVKAEYQHNENEKVRDEIFKKVTNLIVKTYDYNTLVDIKTVIENIDQFIKIKNIKSIIINYIIITLIKYRFMNITNFIHL